MLQKEVFLAEELYLFSGNTLELEDAGQVSLSRSKNGAGFLLVGLDHCHSSRHRSPDLAQALGSHRDLVGIDLPESGVPGSKAACMINDRPRNYQFGVDQLEIRRAAKDGQNQSLPGRVEGDVKVVCNSRKDGGGRAGRNRRGGELGAGVSLAFLGRHRGFQ